MGITTEAPRGVELRSSKDELLSFLMWASYLENMFEHNERGMFEHYIKTQAYEPQEGVYEET